MNTVVSQNIVEVCEEIKEQFISKLSGMHWHKKGIFYRSPRFYRYVQNS